MTHLHIAVPTKTRFYASRIHVLKTAHDKVWHAGLLRKLEALGVQSKLLQWFDSYLRNRKPRVVIEGQG